MFEVGGKLARQIAGCVVRAKGAQGVGGHEFIIFVEGREAGKHN
jgi:hypothetical protein